MMSRCSILDALIVCLWLMSSSTMSYSFGISTVRSTMTMKRRGGAGGFKKKGGARGSPESRSRPTEDQVPASSRWVVVSGVKSAAELPTEQGRVQLIDTMADVLVNAATNPTGAVSVVRYGDFTYCFSSSCPSCQIPLNKAKVLPANDETGGQDPRLRCDFCSATYNIRTGEKVTSEGGGGVFGGIAKAVFSSKSAGALPTYGLGEKDGRVLINLG